MSKIIHPFWEVFNHIGLTEIAIFAVLFLLFLLFFILGMATFKKKIFPKIFFLIAFLMIFSSPFVIKNAMQNKLYKTEIIYNKAYPLHYTDSFFIDMDIKNIGRKEIKKCLVDIQVFHQEKKLADKIKNFLQPIKIFHYPIEGIIKINQTKKFTIMLDNYPYRGYPYKVYTNCY